MGLIRFSGTVAFGMDDQPHVAALLYGIVALFVNIVESLSLDGDLNFNPANGYSPASAAASG